MTKNAYKEEKTSLRVVQVLPDQKQMPLEGLYLGQKLAEMSKEIARTLVFTNFLCDRNGVIAKTDEQHNTQIPVELKNTSDWRLFQELMAQAEVIIIGAAYLKRVAAMDNRAENILSQFEPGEGFEKLGDWRLREGYKNRNPDLVVVTRSLDFNFPEEIKKSARRIMIFTTDAIANSDKARELTTAGITVIGSGEVGVDGNRMIDTLGNKMGYRVVMMASGPNVLELLLEAKRLDLFYITEVQREIPFNDPSTLKTLLPGGKKIYELKEFSLTHKYMQENVLIEDGSNGSQFFLRYDRKDLLVDLHLNAS
jgi:riboflavin biosynthesis pyrimidine reductase